MKKCRHCSRRATLHVTEINDNVAVPIHLCDDCAHGYLNGSNAPEDEVPTQAAELAAKLEALVADEDEECSNCNISFSQFRDQGRLGCAACYDEFRQDLMPLLENIHEDSTHAGKRPRRNPGQSASESQLVHLRSEQRKAIDREDYESAATLRDEIARLEAELHNFPISTAEDSND
ncbi:MAG: DNA helicase UvrBC [Porticoccaceae bacterium]|nr:DNA helicase UvrBC [Porticoccaceae bacterium]